MIQLINMCGTGECPEDFTQITMISLKWKPKALKCSDHRTFSLMAHTAKMISRILGRRTDRKIEDVLGENRCGFRSGKELGMQLGC
jgi:hypothetical protein